MFCRRRLTQQTNLHNYFLKISFVGRFLKKSEGSIVCCSVYGAIADMPTVSHGWRLIKGRREARVTIARRRAKARRRTAWERKGGRAQRSSGSRRSTRWERQRRPAPRGPGRAAPLSRTGLSRSPGVPICIHRLEAAPGGAHVESRPIRFPNPPRDSDAPPKYSLL